MRPNEMSQAASLPDASMSVQTTLSIVQNLVGPSELRICVTGRPEVDTKTVLDH